IRDEAPITTIRRRSEFRNSSPLSQMHERKSPPDRAKWYWLSPACALLRPRHATTAPLDVPQDGTSMTAARLALSLKGTGIVLVGSHGADIRGPSQRGAGVYAWDTRHLSTYEVRPRGGALRLRSAELLPDGALLRYELGQLRIERRIRVDTAIEDQWAIENPGAQSATFEADVSVDADFRDLFEVRQRRR